LPIAIYSALPDKNSTPVFITDAIKKITGYSVNEFFEKTELWSTIIYSDDKTDVWQSIENHREKKSTLELTYRIVTKSGKIKWIKNEASPILDQNNNIIRIDGFLEDITEIKKIQDQAKHQSNLVDMVSDAIISTDSDLNIKSWNKAAEKIYGYTFDKAIGKNIQYLLYANNNEEKRKKILNQLLKKGYWIGETLQKTKDNREIKIYSSINALKDNNGKFSGVVTVNRDISDLIRKEQRIRVLSKFQSQNPAPVFRIDKNSNILYANKPGEILIKNGNAKSFSLLSKKTINEIIESNKIKKIEFNYKNKTFLFSVVPIYREDYVNLYGMDITNEIKLRNALHKAKSELEIKVKERTIQLQEINRQLIKENQKHKNTLQLLKLEEDRLEALLELSMLNEATFQEITNKTLEQGIKLTQSKIGFIGFLNKDETIYTLHSVSKSVVKECNVIGNPIHWPVYDAGIWADAIRQRKTIIINDYTKGHPHKKGLPKGHLTLKRFMVVPIFDNKKIVVIAGVANKLSDYEKSDERQLFLLLNGMWNYIQKNRSKQELQKARDKLEEKVKQRTAALEVSTEALRKSEERYRLAQQAAKIGSWDWDVLNDILDWSDTMEPMFGFRRGEFNRTYNAFLDCVHPKDRRFVDKSVNDCLKKDIDYDVEYRIIWPDNSIHWIRGTGNIIKDKNGTPIRMIGIVQDITDKREYEESIKKLNSNLLRHATELTSINKELEAFSYSVSHDLRAPLRSIDGFSHALLEDYYNKLDDNARDYIIRIRKATKRMSDIINDLLKLSQITRHSFEHERVNLSELSSSIISELHKENPNRRVKIELDDDLFVSGDKHLLYLALENLIGNSWKFTRKNPKAEIKIGKIIKNGKKVFFIKDNGVGFDMNYADKLFLPFQRLHSNDEFPGIGIGLGIVSRIINRHGGKIWAESKIGKGAKFYFTIRENEI